MCLNLDRGYDSDSDSGGLRVGADPVTQASSVSMMHSAQRLVRLSRGDAVRTSLSCSRHKQVDVERGRATGISGSGICASSGRGRVTVRQCNSPPGSICASLISCAACLGHITLSINATCMLGRAVTHRLAPTPSPSTSTTVAKLRRWTVPVLDRGRLWCTSSSTNCHRLPQ